MVPMLLPVTEAPKTDATPIPVATAVDSAQPVAQETSENPPTQDFSSSERFYSPLVKNIAQKEDIPVSELDQINGTGQGGRVTKNDILSHISTRGSKQNENANSPQPVKEKSTTSPASKSVTATADKDFGGEVEIIEMDRMRKLIAGHMINSKTTQPRM